MRGSSLAILIIGAGLVACHNPQVQSSGNSQPGGGQTGGGGQQPGGGPSGTTTPPPFTVPDPPATPPPPPANMPTATMNCGLTRRDVQRGPADLLLILDRSGSMLQMVSGPAGTPVQKWTEVVGALDLVVKRTEGIVSWGLKLYPMGVAQCAVPDGVEVAMALNNHGTLLGSINLNAAMSGGGSTPTREAVQKGAAFLMASPSTAAKYLLVATDGEPNCAVGDAGGGGGGRGRGDAMGTVAAVTAANAAGIPSFIVGVATAGTDADATLNQMAEQGGRPRNDATKYYPVASRDELVSALEQITGQVASCTFALDPPPPAPNNVAVDVDGMRVNRDTTQTDGWNYGPNNRSIVFYGPACERLKAGAAANVQVIYGCGDTVIP